MAHYRGSFRHVPNRFIDAVADGDMNTVLRIMNDENFHLTPKLVDDLGRSPVQVAVANDEIQILDVLLNVSTPNDFYNGLVDSIRLDRVSAAMVIIRHNKYSDYRLAWNIPQITVNENGLSNTPPNLSYAFRLPPLVLAAIEEQFKIVKLLVDKGESIELPHKRRCKCNECKNSQNLDSFKACKNRLNTYKALASTSYISVASSDPILTAIQFARKLRLAAETDKFFAVQYKALAESLSSYLADVLDQITSHREMEFVFNRNAGVGEHGPKQKLLSRVQLAIEYEEKQFVAHPACQQYVNEIFYKNGQIIEDLPWYTKIPIATLYSMAYPLLALLYILLPKVKFLKFMKTPFLKFFIGLSSYLVFLVMIFISGLFTVAVTDQSNYQYLGGGFNKYLARTGQSDGPQKHTLTVRPSWGTLSTDYLTWMIILWILGIFWNETKQIYEEGFKKYISDIFNIIDTFILILYIASFACVFSSFYRTDLAVSFFNMDRQTGWDLLIAESLGQVKSTLAGDHYYWLIADRYYWEAQDPIVLKETLFAIGNLLSFCRISYYLPISSALGPLKITLGRILTDIIKFMVIFVLAFIPFWTSLTNLFRYYNTNNVNKTSIVDHGLNPDAQSTFSTPNYSLSTLFWDLFGYGANTDANLNGYENAIIPQTVGQVLMGIYHILAIIILLNMLIAMMAKSFDNVSESETVEWGFARASLVMDFVHDGNTLAIPFNLIPSVKSMYHLIKRIFCCKGHSDEYSTQDPWAEEEDDIMLHDLQITMNGGGGYRGLPPKDEYERIVQRLIEKYTAEQIENNKSKNEGQEISDYNKNPISSQLQTQAEEIAELKNSIDKIENYVEHLCLNLTKNFDRSINN